MALLKTDSNGKYYVIVESGDTLSHIAVTYSNLTYGSLYQTIASWNQLKNPDLIYPNQKIYLYDPQLKATTTGSNQVVIKQYGWNSAKDPLEELFVTWEFNNHNKTDHYEVRWEYQSTGNLIRTQLIKEEDVSGGYQYSVCNEIPEDAKWIKVSIRPIPKKSTDSNGNEISEFQGSKWAVSDRMKIEYTPDAPTSSPNNVEIDGLTLSVEVENLTNDEDITQVGFQYAQDDQPVSGSIKYVAITETYTASYSWTIQAGSAYRVRVCYRSATGKDSAWTDWSSEVLAKPASVSKLTKCTVKSYDAETRTGAILLEWVAAKGAKSYIVEWTDDQTNFDTEVPVNEVRLNAPSGSTSPSIEISVPDPDKDYYFRVKAAAVNINNEEMLSDNWSEVSSAKVGSGPIAPTTWSSTTTATIGEDEGVVLYWVHNVEDDSAQSYAKVTLTLVEGGSIDGVIESVDAGIGEVSKELSSIDNVVVYKIDNSKVAERDKNKTHSLRITLKGDASAAKINWKVVTANLAGIEGDVSIDRTIYIYKRPHILLKVMNANDNPVETITSLPIKIEVSISEYDKDIHKPIGCHISVLADDHYETVDAFGRSKKVTKNEAVYSNYIDYFDQGQIDNEEVVIANILSANDIDLEAGQNYTIYCVVSMSSSISSTVYMPINVNWSDIPYEPNAVVTFDPDYYVSYITPSCASYTKVYREVHYNNGLYTIVSSSDLPYAYGPPVRNKYTVTGEQVYSLYESGSGLYYCVVESVTNYDNVLFSIYRCEPDGSFTEIHKNVNNGWTVIDPHPSLDYMSYRIVATDRTTGAVSYYDTPAVDVGVKSMIIQWDEVYNDVPSEDGYYDYYSAPWSGSLLVLPYNIDVSEKSSPDVSLINYAGRSNPVSYYGTQLGLTYNLSSAIEKTDKERLNALRYLQTRLGDVYIREPSGTGYWANIKVSMDQKHRDLTIPVSIEVTRVEGGK